MYEVITSTLMGNEIMYGHTMTVMEERSYSGHQITGCSYQLVILFHLNIKLCHCGGERL